QSDVVIVLIHAGAEGADKTHTPKGAEKAYGEFRGDPRAFSHAMIDAGASMVLGSGPHVIRGIERYNGKLIAYSLGNFAGWGNFGQGGNLSLSGLLTVRVDKNGEIVGGRWLSLKLADPGVPAVDKQNTSGKLVEKLSASDFSDTFEMDSNGNFGPGK
ncbi:MAG: CapA family protein, partial [Coriobacteriia bacterium]